MPTELPPEDAATLRALRTRVKPELQPDFDTHCAAMHEMATTSRITSFLPIIMGRSAGRAIIGILTESGVENPKQTTDNVVDMYVRLAGGQAQGTGQHAPAKAANTRY